MKNIVTIVLFITSGIFATNAATTGDPVKATISDHMVITLPTDQPLQTHYVIDISAANFASDNALQQFCMNFSEHYFVMTGNFAEKKIDVAVTIAKDSAGNIWDAARWNEYLAQRAPKMEAFVQSTK